MPGRTSFVLTLFVACAAFGLLCSLSALLVHAEDDGHVVAGATPTATVPVVANDHFADAVELGPVPFAAVQSTEGFSVEGGAPLNPLDCVISPPNEKGATAWYRFMAGETGLVELNTLGSNFDTVLAVYTGTALDALTPLACNDDGGIGVGLQSRISGLTVSAGTTYIVQAGGFSGDMGALQVNGSVAPQPTPTPTAPAATMTPTRTATPEEETGDADCNGSVNAIDATRILQYSAELLDELECADGADVNDDGAINALDAALILQFVAGIIDEFWSAAAGQP